MSFRLRARQGEAIVIAGGRIADPNTAADLDVDLGAGVVMPGLINAHDHLHRNHYPRLGSPPYPDVYAWGEDLHSRFKSEIDRAKTLPRDRALLFGALKNLVGGVTTVVHHDKWESLFEEAFPIRVVPLRVAHTLRLEDDLERAFRPHGRTMGQPACIHLAEGRGREVAEEVRALERMGWVNDELLAVHLVGADDGGIELLRKHHAAVVWCPTSNAFLYEATAPAKLFAPGIDVLLGTDALLTGEGTLLHELRAARKLRLLDDHRLRAAVGHVAAQRLRIPTPSLAAGSRADLLFVRRPIFDALPADVALVITEGVPQLGDEVFAGLFDACGVAVEPLVVGGTRKLLAAPLGSVARQVMELTPECRRIFA